MCHEPRVDRDALYAVIATAYAIEVRALTFLPIGFAACYDLTGADGARYFLKLWPDLRLDTPPAVEHRATLEFSRALHEASTGLHVTYPLLARTGEVWAALARTPFALFPYVEGTTHSPLTAPQRRAVGAAVAALHLTTPALRHLVPRHEAFEVSYEPALLANLEVTGRASDGARNGTLAARDWVRAARAGLEQQLARLHDLQSRARAIECPPVICHMDLHGGNVLLDTTGTLHLIDWDDVRLAPPEFDLWLGLDRPPHDVANTRALIEGYRKAGGTTTFHLDHLAFYLLRRDLEDVSIALDRLLDDSADHRDDDRWTRGLHEWGAPRWSRLDTTLELVAAALG